MAIIRKSEAGLAISPTAQAAEARARADTLTGKDRDYWLWLAGEWNKSAARQAHQTREMTQAASN